MKCYEIEYASDIGHMMYIDIYDTTDTSDTLIEWTGSASPCIITMQDSSSAFTPIRETRATINVIQTFAERLELTDNLRYFVEVYDDTLGKAIWRGFLRAETYTQEYTSEPTRYTYNAVDMLGAAESIRLKDTTVTFRQALSIVMAKVPWDDAFADNGDIYIGNSTPIRDTSRYETETFDLATKAEHWRNYDDETGEMTLRSCLDLMREFCTLIGVTIFSNGVDLYIGSSEDTEYCHAISVKSCASGAAWVPISMHDINTARLADLDIAGNHDISIRQPFQSLAMNYGGKAYDGGAIPKLAPEEMKVAFYGQFNGTNTKGQSFPWFVIYEQGKDDSTIEVFRRHISATGYTSEVVEATKNNWQDCAAGAAFIRQDYWNTRYDGDDEKDFDHGSGSGTDKRNYDLKDTLVIWGYDKSTNKTISERNSRTSEIYDAALSEAKQMRDAKTQQPLFIMKSKRPVYLDRGGLCLSFTAIIDNTYFPLHNSSVTKRQCDLICSLKIGNLWWNGTSFGTAKSRFYVPVHGDEKLWTDGKENDNTKTLGEQYTCNGYSMNLFGQTLSGIMEFTIYGMAAATVIDDAQEDGAGHIVHTYTAYVRSSDITQIFGLTIDYCEPFDYVLKDDESEATNSIKQTHEGGSGDDDITTELCSGVGVRNNDGIVAGTSSMMVPATTSSGNAEQIAFERISKTAFAAKESLNITVQNDEIMMPTSNYSHGGKTYRLERIESYDTISNKLKATFVKL